VALTPCATRIMITEQVGGRARLGRRVSTGTPPKTALWLPRTFASGFVAPISLQLLGSCCACKLVETLPAVASRRTRWQHPTFTIGNLPSSIQHPTANSLPPLPIVYKYHPTSKTRHPTHSFRLALANSTTMHALCQADRCEADPRELGCVTQSGDGGLVLPMAAVRISDFLNHREHQDEARGFGQDE
jgi:hypothetical protein